MYEIEKKIPLVIERKYPFHKMEVGDSFAFDVLSYSLIVSSANYYMKNNAGSKFVVIKKSGRCWRTE